MLWFLRRPKIKWLRANSHKILPVAIQQKAIERTILHDKFARRYGVRLLTFSVMILLSSILVSAMGLLALRMIDEGWLTFPEKLKAN